MAAACPPDDFLTHARACASAVRYAVDDALAPEFPLGVELEVFVRREGDERFIQAPPLTPSKLRERVAAISTWEGA